MSFGGCCPFDRNIGWLRALRLARHARRPHLSLWETPEQLAAGDALVAEFVAANPIITMDGATEVYAGTIGYADELGGA